MYFNLIVFDLDFTLWNAGGKWCDQTFPPYRKVHSHILDSMNNKIYLYPEVKDILSGAYQLGYTMGLASRTFEPSWARNLLRLFEIDHFFSYQEIYPGSKAEHFRQLKEKTGFEFSEMIFFDDEERNIVDVEMLGVKAVLVENGINRTLINKFLNNRNS